MKASKIHGRSKEQKYCQLQLKRKDHKLKDIQISTQKKVDKIIQQQTVISFMRKRMNERIGARFQKLDPGITVNQKFNPEIPNVFQVRAQSQSSELQWLMTFLPSLCPPLNWNLECSFPRPVSPLYVRFIEGQLFCLFSFTDH